MNNKEVLREKILSTNYYLTQAIIISNIEEIERLRAEMNNLIELYKKELIYNGL